MAIVHSYVDLFRKWWEGVLFASNFIVMLPMIPSLFSQPMAHTQGIKSRCQGMTSMKGLTDHLVSTSGWTGIGTGQFGCFLVTFR